MGHKVTILRVAFFYKREKYKMKASYTFFLLSEFQKEGRFLIYHGWKKARDKVICAVAI